VQAQIKGSIFFGLSAALHDHMDFKAGLPPLAPTMAGTIACINRKRLRAFYK